MSDIRADAPPPPRRPGRVRRVAIVLALIVLAGVIVVWFDRKPIARGYITRTLDRAGVPARYTLAELGTGHQRLTNVVIGDPAHPDLVADWIETETAIGLSGPRLTGLRAGHVRLRATLANGRLSLGAIDRLLPAPSGARFALPSIDLSVADARVRLATPVGTFGVKLAGAGRLDDGFRGSVAAVADRVAAGGCDGTTLAAALRVATKAGRPRFTGPVRLGGLACGGVRVAGPAADVDVTLAADLAGWTGHAAIATHGLAARGYAAQALRGDVSFDGTAAQTQGRVALTLLAPRSGVAGAVAVDVAGAYRIGATSAFDGTVGAAHAVLVPPIADALGGTARSVAGTPVGPIADRIAQGWAAMARDLSGQAAVALAWSNGRGVARVASARIASASGMQASVAGGAGMRLAWPSRALTVDTDATLGGGGLPGVRAALRQSRPGGPVRGVATVDPYGASDARLALTPVAFTVGAGGAHLATRATLSGPLGDGRIEGLTLPLDVAWNGPAGIVANTRCAPAGFDRLALGGLALGMTRLALCPVDGALVRVAGGRIGGGAMLGGVRLAGTLGGSPFALTTTGATLRLADRGFTVQGVRTNLGPADRATRLDFATVTGTAAQGALAGQFTGGAGQIANVPLLLSNAAGDWRFANGALTLGGTLGVADAAGKDARFKPLVAKAVSLTLADGRIDARGTLHEPATGTKVADVAIRHDLAAGAGTADLTVPGLAFDKHFQPDLLTPLTFGVIADVRGNVIGSGHIAWSPTAVTSTGRFRTGDLDLAAAFGPVSGLAGEIVFTDLLALQSAPGQVATVRTINPGIAVTDGRITYQLLPGGRIQVEGARWPFAGGTLTLDPTLLDFSAPAERRLTFHVDGVAADQFLQQFDFKNLDATGIFDGVLPIAFDAMGGRIEKGVLTVRKGGGGIAYVSDLTQKDLGFWGNLAFQALKSLRYRNLSITMNGPLSGEMVTAVRFAGVTQGQGAKSNFLIHRLQRLPFVFNVTIRAPFRGLLDSAASFYDPKRLIERNLPALLQEQDKQAAAPTPPATPVIQPPASRTVP